MTPSLNCRICDNSLGNREFTVLEMLYGTKEEFTYFECGSCAALQILHIPDNLSKYYPSDYLGSFFSNADTTGEQISPLRLFFKQQRVLYLTYGQSRLGWLVSKMGEDYFGYTWEWFRKGEVTPNSRILDIGCRPGLLLKSLQNQGFSELPGLILFKKKPFQV